MPDIRFLPLATSHVEALRAGGRDAYGLVPERTVSDGGGNPCRHCLGFVPQGAGMLILAHRPFARLQPYAETGPIFLCADPCPAWTGAGMPPMLDSPFYLLRGYTADERICYGTGGMVARDAVAGYARDLLARAQIAFVDVRSARNACFMTRIMRA